MSFRKEFYRSQLQNTSKLTSLLTKMKNLFAVRPLSLVVIRGSRIHLGRSLTGVVINPAAATGTLIFDAGDSQGVTAASVIIADLTYTAKIQGDLLFPNDVTVEYTGGAVAGSEVVTVVGRVVTVQIQSGVSTATQVKTAVDGSAAAASLVAVVVSGIAANTQVIQGPTALAGGTSLQTYDKADFLQIRRVRSRKYKVVLSPQANPAV